MADAGFFRGTTAEQDNRFANKEKKMLRELNFSPILNTKLNMSKIDVISLKPWIDQKIKDVLEKDDEILSQSIYEHLAEKEPDGKSILLLITGFVDDSKASKFLEELWSKLIDLQEKSNGLDLSENNAIEFKSKLIDDNIKANQTDIDPDDSIKNLDSNDNTARDKGFQDKAQHTSSSESDIPPSRSVSKSPGNHRLDELSRGRSRRRTKDGVSRGDSNSLSPKVAENRSRSRSTQEPHSGRSTPRSNTEGKCQKSRSSSRSKHSSSRSRSYSCSASRSKSSSRSRTRSPRQSRSPFGYPCRGGRSRSRSRGYNRPRSRSPRYRRGFGGTRGVYRGSFGFHDRRRPPVSSFRRRSPWGRRRFSPRSPPRRRRSPSYSPRRRGSPLSYSRRSRSRSPPGHVMHRNIVSPRLQVNSSQLEPIGSRHRVHDMHRPMLQTLRSPRHALDHRGYGESHVISKHPSGHIMNKLSDMPTSSHLSLAGTSMPAASGPLSSPSNKKKHKKKHRKHKKSKKHRSASPEKRKKHKKHKKTKKSHKSR